MNTASDCAAAIISPSTHQSAKALRRSSFSLVAHAGPHVGGDQVGAAAGVERMLVHRAGIAADAGHVRIQLVAERRAHVQLEAQDVGGLQPRVGHVVAVADPGHHLARDAAAVLDEGEDVGQHLARVVFVGEPLITGTREWAAKRSSLSCS
jgi:hypothetical protein